MRVPSRITKYYKFASEPQISTFGQLGRQGSRRVLAPLIRMIINWNLVAHCFRNSFLRKLTFTMLIFEIFDFPSIYPSEITPIHIFSLYFMFWWCFTSFLMILEIFKNFHFRSPEGIILKLFLENSVIKYNWNFNLTTENWS